MKKKIMSVLFIMGFLMGFSAYSGMSTNCSGMGRLSPDWCKQIFQYYMVNGNKVPPSNVLKVYDMNTDGFITPGDAQLCTDLALGKVEPRDIDASANLKCTITID